MDSSQRQRWLAGLSMLAVAAAALLLYSRSLTFAFFNDDPTGHFAWMEGRGILDYFLSSADYGYYRPVVFATLQLFVNAFAYEAGWFHALLIGLHAVNTALVWLLAYWLGRRMAYAWFAALLFATLPFSYEAVAYVASLTHPLVTFWALAAVLLYDVALARRQRGLRATFAFMLAAVSLIMALFSHENGLIVPFMLAGVDWLRRPPSSLRDAWQRPYRWTLIAAAAFLLIWLAIPKSGDQAVPTLTHIGRNSLPFLQTLLYPLLPLLRLDSSQAGTLVLLGLATVVVMGLLARYARAVGLWLFALAWMLLSSLPAILFLTTDYLYGSPRLHYLPAVGVALFWGIPLLALARLPVARPWQKGMVALAQAALMLAAALPPLSFVRCELDFYAAASQIVNEMGAYGAAAPVEQDLLFVNVPFFFSSTAQHPDGCPNPYPWTPVGAVVMPPYARTADFVRFNGGPDRPATAVTVAEYAPGWTTFGPEMSLSEVRGRLGDTAVAVFDLATNDFYSLSEAWRPAQEPLPALATFDDRLDLVDAAADVAPDRVAVDLLWQVRQAVDGPAAAFVHVYNADGMLVAQHDAPPARGFVPTALWQPGDQMRDALTIPLTEPLPPGPYTVAAGLYNPLTGDRWPAMQNGMPLPDQIYVVAQSAVEE